MNIKTYRAPTLKEALAQIKKELGSEALILDQKEIRPKRVLGVFGKPYVEVTAAVDYAQEAPAAPVPSSLAESGDRVTLSHSDLPAAPGKSHAPDETRVLLEEIRKLRSVIQSMPPPLPLNRSTILRASRQFPSQLCAEVHAELLYCGIDEELAACLVQEANAEANPATDDKPAFRKRVLTNLGARIRIEPDIIPQASVTSPQVIALIGPTGVGKTTTVAKLAAKAALERRLRVGLVTTDTFRIAAVEQLKTYAEIIGIPARVAENTAEITESLSVFANNDVILVDTAGRSQREMSSQRELADFLSKSSFIKTALVLSATIKQTDLDDIVERYEMFDPNWIIFTKLDETEAHGSVISGLLRSGKPLAFVTVGQRVPQDIVQPSAAQMAGLALGTRGLACFREVHE